MAAWACIDSRICTAGRLRNSSVTGSAPVLKRPQCVDDRELSRQIDDASLSFNIKRGISATRDKETLQFLRLSASRGCSDVGRPRANLVNRGAAERGPRTDEGPGPRTKDPGRTKDQERTKNEGPSTKDA